MPWEYNFVTARPGRAVVVLIAGALYFLHLFLRLLRLTDGLVGQGNIVSLPLTGKEESW
jgi:hypothetical protein